MRRMVSAIAALATLGLFWPALATAEPVKCDDPSCVPGINRVVALGAYCDSPTYYVFATTDWGRVVFCGSARGLPPRYFRSLPLAGIREVDTPCPRVANQVAQGPDGLLLVCQVVTDKTGEGVTLWVRGDHYDNPNSPW